jgi:hypothetical protein
MHFRLPDFLAGKEGRKKRRREKWNISSATKLTETWSQSYGFELQRQPAL